MTVPGKGGRPRKWRTDADRVRAFRARQQGIAEPPVLTQALERGDALAQAVELAGQLRREIHDLRATVRQLKKELADSKRARKAEARRFEWIESRNVELVNERDAVAVDRDQLAHELDEVRDELRDLRARLEPSRRDPAADPSSRPLPRAERRRLDRDRRRGGA